MKKPIYLFVLTYLHLSVSTSNKTEKNTNRELSEMEYREGTFIEPKYSLPPVNVSVSDNRTAYTVTSSLARMLDFYNSELLSAQWGKIKDQLSGSCKEDLNLYIEGLSRAENWALKMDDASGRYSTGWFWGNHYWTGSQNLCENINVNNPKILDNANSTTPQYTTILKRNEYSPSMHVNYKMDHLSFTSDAPLQVSFFMLRINLNSSFSSEGKILHMGLCLPYVCTDEDVKTIVQETSTRSSNIKVIVEAVRSHHNRFNIWTDKTFQILSIATSVLVLFLIIGTCYDFYLEHLKKKKMCAMNCARYNSKLELSMTDSKSKNGKCGFYAVNNNNVNMNNNHTNFQSIEANVGVNPRPREPLTRLIFRETLLSFSVRANFKTIFNQAVGSDTISVIHGLKSISMAWVILGHTCIVAFKYSDNMEYRKVVQKEFIFQTISNGTFSVDTFFFTSGLLVSFLYFRTNAKGKLDPLTNGRKGFVAGLLHFFGLILYRFARLTVPYLFTIGVVEVTMKWFNYNSVFEPPTMDHENCPNYWWRNMLYVNTLFPVEEMCMLWSWYLSDDTQFYVVGAVMLILAASHFKSAAALLVLFLTSSWITTGYIAYSNSHMPGSDDPLALFDKIYDKPWTRLGPYLIGMCIGWFLFKKECRITISKFTLIVGWTASIACLLALVYGLYEANLTPIAGAAYSALSHSAWALGLAWIVVACTTGYGGYINKILSSAVLYPFSRVTYCAYLIHPIVIRVMVMSMDSPLHLGSIVTIVIFMGQVVASYCISFFVSVAFEAPVVSLLRIMSKIVANRKRSRITPPES